MIVRNDAVWDFNMKLRFVLVIIKQSHQLVVNGLGTGALRRRRSWPPLLQLEPPEQDERQVNLRAFWFKSREFLVSE